MKGCHTKGPKYFSFVLRLTKNFLFNSYLSLLTKIVRKKMIIYQCNGFYIVFYLNIENILLSYTIIYSNTYKKTTYTYVYVALYGIF